MRSLPTRVPLAYLWRHGAMSECLDRAKLAAVACRVFSCIRPFLLLAVAIFGHGHVRLCVNLDRSGMFGGDDS